MNKVLEVKNLSIGFTQYGKKLEEIYTEPIKLLNLDIKKGEILAVVGASGSGKSLLAHCIMGILPNNATVKGEILYKKEKLTEDRISNLRGKEIAFIPQSVNYLDPRMKVKNLIKIGLNGSKEEKQVIQEKLFLKYGLDIEDGELYPHQLSGGMLRRVLFATSIKEEVELIIADEPTPGIHPEILEVMLNQLRDLANEGKTIMLITHDIASAIKVADRVIIFKDGMNVEDAPASNFVGDGDLLMSDYARELWNSLPTNRFLEMEE